MNLHSFCVARDERNCAYETNGVKTISTYRARILEKMGMKNNAQLMRYAMEHQLVE